MRTGSSPITTSFGPSGGKGKTLASNVSNAIININKLTGKINGSVDHFQAAADNVSSASQHFNSLADSVTTTSGDARTFFSQGKNTLQNVSGLAVDLRSTDQKINKILEHPAISRDLKDMIAKAQDVSRQISATVNQLNATLGNDTTRHDLITIMTKLNDSTSNIQRSLQTLSSISTDKEFRADLKDVVAQASTALDKAHALLDKHGTDLGDTITRVRSAATNVDIAARQLQDALQHKHPLMHLMFGKGVKIPSSGEAVVVPVSVEEKSPNQQ